MTSAQRLAGLMVAQALALSSAPLMVFIGGLIGAQLHPDPSFSTLPIAAMIIGMASAVWPASRLAGRYGRRPIFVGAMLVGVVSSLLAAFAVYQFSFWGFTASAWLFGCVGAVIQQFRFLAMSFVPQDQKASAASKLLLAGLASAFIGPELSSLAEYFPTLGFAAAFVGLSLCMLLAGVVLLFVVPVKTSVNTAIKEAEPRSWPELFRQPDLILAMSAAAVAYVVMSFVMTATPLSMTTLSGHNVGDAKWIIQNHIVAMFLPSLFTGRLVGYFGIHRVMLVGLLLFVCSLCIGAYDESLLHYLCSLILLGVGWNFLFVTGTALLAQCYQSGDAAKVQGMNDMLVFGTQAIGSLGSGAILLMFGWQALLLIAATGLVWLALVMSWNYHLRHNN